MIKEENSVKTVRERRAAYHFKNGAVYEGEWLGDNRDGFGVQVWSDGAKYEGKFYIETSNNSL